MEGTMGDEPHLHGAAHRLASLVEYQAGAIVSRILLKQAKGSVTLFAFDQGQELSEHTSPHDALVQVVDGKAEITIAGQTHGLKAGEMIVMPANQPHAVMATDRFKMLLTLIRA
jgi:quercetin dioxygenase-like cupin family protein